MAASSLVRAAGPPPSGGRCAGSMAGNSRPSSARVPAVEHRGARVAVLVLRRAAQRLDERPVGDGAFTRERACREHRAAGRDDPGGDRVADRRLADPGLADEGDESSAASFRSAPGIQRDRHDVVAGDQGQRSAPRPGPGGSTMARGRHVSRRRLRRVADRLVARGRRTRAEGRRARVRAPRRRHGTAGAPPIGPPSRRRGPSVGRGRLRRAGRGRAVVRRPRSLRAGRRPPHGPR